MDLSVVVNFILIIIAILMLFYIISSRSKNIILEESIVEEYTGAAKNPNKLDEPNDEVEVDLEEETQEKILINTDERPQENTKQKKQKNFKILNIFVVTIISFVAFIIIVDTLKYPIGKIVPNVEFILYNLYESIKDISLFIRDLM